VPLDIHEYHRVERVLGFISSCRNWNPSPAGECVPPLYPGKGDTFDCGTEGVGVSTQYGREGTDTVILRYIGMYFVINAVKIYRSWTT
jgi:hypothetical protein